MEKLVESEVKLTHAEPSVIKAIQIYCFAVQYLLENQLMDEDKKRKQAYEEAKNYAKSICTKKNTRPVLEWLENAE